MKLSEDRKTAVYRAINESVMDARIEIARLQTLDKQSVDEIVSRINWKAFGDVMDALGVVDYGVSS